MSAAYAASVALPRARDRGADARRADEANGIAISKQATTAPACQASAARWPTCERAPVASQAEIGGARACAPDQIGAERGRSSGSAAGRLATAVEPELMLRSAGGAQPRKARTQSAQCALWSCGGRCALSVPGW